MDDLRNASNATAIPVVVVNLALCEKPSNGSPIMVRSCISCVGLLKLRNLIVTFK